MNLTHGNARQTHGVCSDLISRQDVIIALDKSGLCYNNWLEVRNEIDAVPSADAVSKGVYEQTKWERDVALKTLEEHGIGFGQKVDTDGDLISRQNVYDALEQYDREHVEPQGYDDYYNGFLNVIQAIPAEPQWIPCSEKLPEDIKPVIVTWKNTDPKSYYQYIVGKHFIGAAHYKNGKWFWYSSVTEDLLAEYGKCDGEEFDEAIEVIAWMPLPEPYKAESEDDEQEL